ncbi:MAG: ABC transporter ATP-binding protein [Planctomycetota bacterium]|nr:ABC transporter ATP-binding protein [Planctomycetota bacterium]
MYAFMAPVKFHVAVNALLYVAYSITEVLTLYLLKTPVNIVQKFATGEVTETADAGVWAWMTTPGSQGEALLYALIWLGAARLALSLFAWGKTVSQSWQSMSMVYYMRAAVYDRLQRVGFSFHDQYSTGEMVNRSLSDLQNVRLFVNQGLFGGIDILFTMAGCFYLFLRGSPSMALAALLSLPFWFWAIRKYALLSQPIYERQMDASDEMVQVLTENIAGVHVVRAFATEDLERGKFETRCKTLLKRMLEGVNLQVKMTPLIRGIAAASHVLLFTLGAVLVQRGQLELGDLIVFGSAMTILLARVQQLNQITDAYQRAVVSSGRLFEVLESPDSTPERPDSAPLRPGGGGVKFSRVTFGYEPGRPVLNDVSFTVPAGSKVAIVGPTGAGKTTLSALLGRFYDPDLGSIAVDGVDLRDATLSSVRSSVGYVFQENYLFSDTVARNIAYSDLGAQGDAVKEAARVAHAHEFIERLPNRYNTVIGEYGASLSGGQKQRLAIARAILHNPRILVLDDALSAVDPETEARIREELERIMAGRTVFLITSRISTARQADRILVLSQGRIVQEGTHDDLMAEPGYYRDVASSQFAASEGAMGTLASHMDRISRASARRSGRLDDEP